MLSNYSFSEISLAVPNTWTVKEIEGALEIVEESAQGAMHISFLKRVRSEYTKAMDARRLLQGFATNNNLDLDGDIQDGPLTSGVLATGRFHARAQSTETPMFWFLASVVWEDKALQVSYCTDDLDDETLRVVNDIVASIQRRDR